MTEPPVRKSSGNSGHESDPETPAHSGNPQFPRRLTPGPDPTTQPRRTPGAPLRQTGSSRVPPVRGSHRPASRAWARPNRPAPPFLGAAWQAWQHSSPPEFLTGDKRGGPERRCRRSPDLLRPGRVQLKVSRSARPTVGKLGRENSPLPTPCPGWPTAHPAGPARRASLPPGDPHASMAAIPRDDAGLLGVPRG